MAIPTIFAVEQPDDDGMSLFGWVTCGTARTTEGLTKLLAALGDYPDFNPLGAVVRVETLH